MVSYSTGKDSTATAIKAMENFPKDRVVVVTADTGNEHEHTYRQIEVFEKESGLKVHVVKADFSKKIIGKRKFIEKHWANHGVEESHIKEALEILKPTGNAFIDLCMWKGRFPSRMAQFCTQELKVYPLREFTEDLLDKYGWGNVESWQGVRRDESHKRKDALEREVVPEEGITIVRPIVEWSAQQTVDYIKEKGFSLNPLYSEGRDRVGCMPCINSKKSEIAQMAKRFPDHVDKIRRWEHLVALASKRGAATFFAPLNGNIADIDERVRWSFTKRGGKEVDESWDGPNLCESSYGLCE